MATNTDPDDSGFVPFFRQYTKTWIHTVSTVGLTAFGMLTFVNNWFALLALATYVLPPIVLYWRKLRRHERDAVSSAPSESATQDLLSHPLTQMLSMSARKTVIPPRREATSKANRRLSQTQDPRPRPKPSPHRNSSQQSNPKPRLKPTPKRDPQTKPTSTPQPLERRSLPIRAPARPPLDTL